MVKRNPPWMVVARGLLELRPGFSRYRTFCWFSLAVVGMLLHRDLFGVTSLVRAVALPPWTYDRLLDVFHQSSESNTKPEYVTGHSTQAIGVLVRRSETVFALPLFIEIKVRLMDLACDWTGTMPSPFEGDAGVVLQYRCENLIAAHGHTMRYVIVCHPTRGTAILASTGLTLTSEEIIQAYALRFKIEVTFKAAVHTIGTFNYHFWMKGMDRLSRWPRDPHLHRKSASYRTAVRRKTEAYHRFLQLGVIAHGLMHVLATQQPQTIWRHFGSWLRTMNPSRPPSEFVVAAALRNTAEDFPQAFADVLGMRKSLDHIHRRRLPTAAARAA